MAPGRPGFLAQAWHAWKSMRLPWRKRFFVGYDLHGNTYWQFRLVTRGPPSDSPDADAAVEPWRRIVHYPRSMHYSDVKVSPLWHQWLRQTRNHAPSLQEQRDDVRRQERVKLLAAQADARWEAKPRVSDGPGHELPATLPHAAPPPEQDPPLPLDKERQRARSSGKDESGSKNKARGPGEDWQPASWSPR